MKPTKLTPSVRNLAVISMQDPSLQGDGVTEGHVPKQAAPKTIVKVQLPMTSSKGEPALALVYNRDQSVLFQCPVTTPLLARMQGKAKGYFHATIEPAGDIEINEPAPDQPW